MISIASPTAYISVTEVSILSLTMIAPRLLIAIPADTYKIKEYVDINKPKHATVVGGGFIGIQ